MLLNDLFRFVHGFFSFPVLVFLTSSRFYLSIHHSFSGSFPRSHLKHLYRHHHHLTICFRFVLFLLLLLYIQIFV